MVILRSRHSFPTRTLARVLVLAVLCLLPAEALAEDAPPQIPPKEVATEAALLDLDRRYQEKFGAIEAKFVASEKQVETALIASDKRYEQRFAAQEKAVEAALSAAEKAVNAALIAAKEAVTKAEVASEKRFDAVNEFRGQLKDQANTLLPRTEFDATKKLLDSLSSRLDRMEGALAAATTIRTDSQQTWGLWVAIVGLIFGVMVAWFARRDAMNARQSPRR
jgi:hypothetical protein